MADSESTTDEVQNQVEAPEVTDQADDIEVDLEDFGGSFDDVEDDGKPYKADKAAKSDDDEEEDTDDASDDELEEDADDETEEDDKEAQLDDEAEDAEESDPEKSQLPDEEQVKQRNKEMAERRLAAKTQREAVITSKKQEYIDAAESEEDSAMRHLEVEAYDSRVDRNTTKLVTASDRAFADFPILNDADPAIQQEVNDALDKFQAENVVIDNFGNPTKIKGDLYETLKAKADSIAKLTGKGARQQIESKKAEKSKAFTRPTRAPKKPKSDPALDAFNEEANRW